MNNDSIGIIIILSTMKNFTKLLTLNKQINMLDNKYTFKQLNYKYNLQHISKIIKLHKNDFTKLLEIERMFKNSWTTVTIYNEEKYFESTWCNANIFSNEIKYLTDIIDIRVSYNNFITIPHEINNCKYLYCIDLMGNNLISLPNELENLKNLNKFVLDYNNFIIFPTVLYKFKNLEKLWLRFNNIISISNEINNMSSLDTIYLQHNKLFSLPRNIGLLKKLKHIEINKNPISILPTELLINRPRCVISTFPHITNVKLFKQILSYDIANNNTCNYHSYHKKR